MSRKILVCGSANCIWNDLKQVQNWDGDVMAVNITAFHLPMKINHWVSFHHEFFKTAIPFFFYLKPEHPEVITHSSDKGENVTKVWKFDYHDKSGWFAVKVASELNYNSIVLAGIPMDESTHFYDNVSCNYKWKSYLWNDLPKYKIKSLSGNTMKYFGNINNGS